MLHKIPKGKEVESTDSFVFNENFNDRLYRIRISQVQMRETVCFLCVSFLILNYFNILGS